jgi:3-dehydroquinate dehydratase-1
MAPAIFQPTPGQTLVVGSFGSSTDLRETSALTTSDSCDLAEIRLDVMMTDSGEVDPTQWHHLSVIPLLFTARRRDEGGAGALDASRRMNLLRSSLEQAALVDIEVASIDEMGALLDELKALEIPWIASFHDFNQLPATRDLEQAAQRAREAGAAIFKTAAMLSEPADVARLAEFQLADHGIPVASMGMGPLAPVSRLLCAQCGSLLNYGYLGKTTTAPGQWDALTLKQAICRLQPLSR